ncbi:MAG: metallophosphoesterase family protein [Acidobacteriota bacterium]
MRYLVLADLHSNLEALRAALGYARRLGFERALVLGDIVGYGADPNGVVDALRALPELTAIRGNHDRVAAGITGPDGFNEAARASAEWTHRSLREDNRDYLGGLPRGPLEFSPGSLLAHGTPLDEDAYLLDGGGARACFESRPFDLCFIGHTHYPSLFALNGDEVSAGLLRGGRVEVRLAAGARFLINPGSLGQPRDRDPRCSFAIYDDDARTVTLHRLEYPVETARRKILDAGLPAVLGDRLRAGV